MEDKGRQRRIHHQGGRSVELRPRVCHGAAMRKRSSMAGGFFLTFLIIGGLVAGVLFDNAMGGVLIGTAAGVAMALLLWLLDRRRAG
jgi:hypothetical protein